MPSTLRGSDNFDSAAKSIGEGGSVTTNLFGVTRANNTTYNNTTGRPLVIYVRASNSPGNGTIEVFINGVNVMNINMYGSAGGGCVIVPIGATYRFNQSNSTILEWYEY